MRKEYIIADKGLAPEGRRRIDWAWEYMPVLNLIAEREEKYKPLDGLVIGCCLHLEAKTACLLKVMHRLGATVVTAGSNPFQHRMRYAPLLSKRAYTYSAGGHDPRGIREHRGDAQVGSADNYRRRRRRRFDGNENVEPHPKILEGCEETTTASAPEVDAGRRLLSDACCQRRAGKYLFDNEWTGQSAWDAILRTTNLIVAGKNVVIGGTDGAAGAQNGRGLSARSSSSRWTRTGR